MAKPLLRELLNQVLPFCRPGPRRRRPGGSSGRKGRAVPLTVEALGSEVDAMLASGDIGNRGAAESLRAFLAQAARARDAGDTAAERDALQRFAEQARRLSGSQLTPAAADRLASLAATLIAAL